MTRKRFVKILRAFGFPQGFIEGYVWTVKESKGQATYRNMWEFIERLFNLYHPRESR